MEAIISVDCRLAEAAEKLENLSERQCKFGKEIRNDVFRPLGENSVSKTYWFTNHGSYGTVPRPVRDVHDLLQRVMDEHPDSWFRRRFVTLYFSACNAAAEFIGAANEEVVLVDNATTAVNTVLRSLKLGGGDGIMLNSMSYLSCSIAARAICESSGAKLHVMDIRLPITSKESIIEMYRDYLDSHSDVTFVLVDHITSPAAILMPVREITSLCKERGVRVMVDAAHSPGQLPLDVKELGVDYATGNFHKWMFSSRGCALLYVKEGLQDSIYPLVAAQYYYKLSWRERFLTQGTRNMIAFCIPPVAIQFFKKIGGLKAVTEYNWSLLDWATEMLCQRLSVPPLPVPPDMKAPFMSLVILPVCLGPATKENEDRLREKLFHDYGVQTNTCVVDGRLCCRISAQVYNIREDYEKLADALQKEIEQATS